MQADGQLRRVGYLLRGETHPAPSDNLRQIAIETYSHLNGDSRASQGH
jgi:hypothetical protein